MMFSVTALELSAAMQAGELRVAEAVEAYIRQIEETNPRYNSFLTLAAEQALARAEVIQALLEAGGAPSPLAGVPVAVKDNLSTRGIRTTCASRMLADYVPVFSATAVRRLEQAGMIVLGKLNMDEFAMGGSSETGAFGAVKNPWDTTRVAGGSSGGSAAAVAAGQIPLALGSDTGGSIRQPCAFCGTTGIKPSYGAVSRYGLIAYASSLDQIGPIGGDAFDCAAMLSLISGLDARDGTCVLEEPFPRAVWGKERLDGLKIGLLRNDYGSGLEAQVRQAVLQAAQTLTTAGAHVEEYTMPLMDYAVPAYYVLACAEASSNLSRYDGLKYGHRSAAAQTLAQVYSFSRSEGFALEVKRRILLGTFALSSGYYDAYYKKALQVRSLIRQAYAQLFTRFDMLLSPVAPTTAYPLGKNKHDPLKIYMGDIYTVPVNLAGLPAVSLPCGFDGQGLPIGFQLIGEAFSEPKLLFAAQVYQSGTNYHTKRPGGAAL